MQINLCKRCKVNPRVSLYFCRECLDKHNKKTRELKQRYRKEGKCAICGTSSDKRYCPECTHKQVVSFKNSEYQKSKKSKAGQYGGLKQISDII